MARKPTETELLKKELQATIIELFDKKDLSEIELDREGHIEFIERGFNDGFPFAYVSLDSSRPWLVYWALQSFDLLGRDLSEDERFRCFETIRTFQNDSTGGFCGGDFEATQQFAHLAPTYASILALAALADPEGYSLLNRGALRSFLESVKMPEGPFRMHQIDGEIDVRSAYCAVVVGKLTACWDDQLEVGLVDWIVSCQTWEGGFAGVPGAEAHGGYTFCALAALNLLNSLHRIKDPMRLIHWLLSQQVDPLGGFRGRTNKLVDACYSFWLGASFDCIGAAKLFDSAALQQFILAACQDPKGGGLRDKPGKSPDFYHTCYALSGLSLAQHQIQDPEFILGGPTSLLKAIDSRYNLIKGKAEAMIRFFS